MTERAEVLDLLKFQQTPSTIVIIDDQSTWRMVLTEVIRVVNSCIKVLAFGNPADAIYYMRDFPADLVVTDYMMPRMDGLETIRELRRQFTADELPIVMTTIVHSRDLMYRAFEVGVSEYLLRPVDPIECRLRIEHLLARRQRYMEQKAEIELLGEQLAKSPSVRADGDFLRRVAAYHTHFDLRSGRSQQNVPAYATLIGRALGCNEIELTLLNTASSVHDIGEMALPSGLWVHGAVYSPEQLREVQQHTHVGHDLLAGSNSDVMQCAAEIALNHHERFDGSGYPRGLSGSEVSNYARIVAVADVFNALVSERPHRPALSCSEAVDRLGNDMRHQFDPEVLGALRSCVNALETRPLASPGWGPVGKRHA